MPDTRYPAKNVSSSQELPKLANPTQPTSGEPGPKILTAIQIAVPAHTFAIIGGTALGIWTQRLTITQMDSQKVYSSDVLTGSLITGSLLKTAGGVKAVTLAPQGVDTIVLLNFETLPTGKTFFQPVKSLNSDYETTRLNVDKFATAYLFHTEDGGDNDQHDCNVVATFIDAVKL